MNILGVGPLELLLILVLAIIFLGPDELPHVARKLAQALKELQSRTSEVSTWAQKEFGPELEELNKVSQELKETSEKVRQAQQVVQNPARAVEEEVKRMVAPPESSAQAAADETPTAEEAPAQQAVPEDAPTPLVQASTRPLSPLSAPATSTPADDEEQA